MRRSSPRPTVVVAGLGDVGALVATRLTRIADVVGISTRPALVSGQELGMRLSSPAQWRRSYLVPLRRFRRLDRARLLHGRIRAVDLDAAQVQVELASGELVTQHYDHLVIATGVSNGFWRHDRVQDLAAVDTEIDATNQQVTAARTIAVIGGGATGVSVADNLARAGRHEVHLFHSGDEPLPEHHPNARRWAARRLRADGVTVHPNHRAEVPDGFRGDRITTGAVQWSTGQEPFSADLTLWAIGGARPHTAFLPESILDPEGFVLVDEHLRVPDHRNVFAVGDVAASDPLRSSARNWGFRVVAANVASTIRGRSRLRSFHAPAYRWGSIIGLQPDGLTVVQPNGRIMRIPHGLARHVLLGAFVERYLYGGLRGDRRPASGR